MENFRDAKNILCNYQLMSAFDIIKDLYLKYGSETILGVIRELSDNKEFCEVNYAGIIYKNDDKVRFNDENDSSWIGVVRFGLYSTFWMNSDTMEINRNEHLGWTVYYDVANIAEDGSSWKESQKTLVDVIHNFGGYLYND